MNALLIKARRKKAESIITKTLDDLLKSVPGLSVFSVTVNHRMHPSKPHDGIESTEIRLAWNGSKGMED